MRTEECRVGARIRLLRLEKNMTQRQLAAKIGVDRTSLSSYEHSKRTPDIFILCRMADVFEVSLDDLVGRKF
ncbi:helix-turn-helix transcriptional regulator [Lachnospiraceae bacterium DSM 108991]|uniref:Helix-turn-helix domain-containing protein n=2 Tax=Lachnospiraceae TaxID=186803 RepID=A0A921LE27_9FIRM|nr:MULTISPECIES: helix-turn-helix transcriptional regulator [Lachnospiraceae]MBE5062383.1 helix-turn-helix transcriptional regulator [Claveliimonas monacensis]HJF94149.1 helix-turn-helix domain-containing protein [Lachnoclostridium phocaeense]